MENKQQTIQDCQDFLTWLLWARFESTDSMATIKKEAYRRARKIGIDLDEPIDMDDFNEN